MDQGEFQTHLGQHAKIVLRGFTLCVEAVVYPFGQFRGPKFQSVEAARSD